MKRKDIKKDVTLNISKNFTIILDHWFDIIEEDNQGTFETIFEF